MNVCILSFTLGIDTQILWHIEEKYWLIENIFTIKVGLFSGGEYGNGERGIGEG